MVNEKNIQNVQPHDLTIVSNEGFDAQLCIIFRSHVVYASRYILYSQNVGRKKVRDHKRLKLELWFKASNMSEMLKKKMQNCWQIMEPLRWDLRNSRAMRSYLQLNDKILSCSNVYILYDLWPKTNVCISNITRNFVSPAHTLL